MDQYSLYKLDGNGKDQLLMRTEEPTDEYKIMTDYFDSIGAKISGYRHLGELRGRVYRKNFKLTVDGVEGEYMVVHYSK